MRPLRTRRPVVNLVQLQHVPPFHVGEAEVGVWLAGCFGTGTISAQAERTDSTPNGWEVRVTVGKGGRGAVVAPRDQEEEVGGERGEGGELDRS